MMSSIESEKILILDFGSQYTQLIARKIRELNVYCEIIPFNTSIRKIEDQKPKGIILSGGPSSVYAVNAPHPEPEIFNLGIPVLGICYGLQIIAHFLNGKVGKAERREYGRSEFFIDNSKDLFSELNSKIQVWMSHGDHLLKIPESFSVIGHTENAPIAAIADFNRRIYGLQFHPEVVHTPDGKKILKNFVYKICGCSGKWTTEAFINESVKKIKETVGSQKVICGLSGGVDSAVTAGLIRKAVGDQLIPVFVDNGVLRKNEASQVIEAFKSWNLHFVDASEQFLKDLHGVTDPEKKRKAIGKRFIEVFEKEAREFGKIDFLAQGTLYP
ncbi:glutamine-hydrolyzing GMP synthase, partial [candidate division KSB1 bacterium]